MGKALFKTPEEVQEIAEEYFKKYPKLENAQTPEETSQAVDCLINGILPTLSGLCLKLGFHTIKQFDDYEKKRLFRSTFEGLRLRLLSYWESALGTGKGSQGVSAWINYTTGGAFLGKATESAGNRGAVAVVVVGADGSRQALSDILQASQTPQIQRVKTIDTTAQEVKPKPAKIQKKKDSRAESNKRNALRKHLIQQEKGE